MAEQTAPKWYEANIGWGPINSWFMVDELPNPYTSREGLVEVKHCDGQLRGIRVEAQFSQLPTLTEVMAVVLANTHCDHLPEVKYHLVSRKEGLSSQGIPDALERLRRCVPAEAGGGTP